MAISKKYSRRIVVGGVAYRWRVQPEVEYDQTAHDGHIIANVWSEEHSARTLRLIGGLPSSETGLPILPVTPGRVAEGIRAALRAGWNPTVVGQTFHLRLSRLAGA